MSSLTQVISGSYVRPSAIVASVILRNCGGLLCSGAFNADIRCELIEQFIRQLQEFLNHVPIISEMAQMSSFTEQELPSPNCH